MLQFLNFFLIPQVSSLAHYVLRHLTALLVYIFYTFFFISISAFPVISSALVVKEGKPEVMKFQENTQARFRIPASVIDSQIPIPQTVLKKRLISRVVGLLNVDTQRSQVIVTSREVAINRGLDWVFDFNSSAKPPSPLNGEEKRYPDYVKSVLLEWAIALEAKSLSIKPKTGKTSEDLDSLESKALNGFRQLSSWREIDPSVEEIREMLERKILARSLTEIKRASFQLSPTDAEVEAFFRTHNSRFPGMKLTEVSERIRKYIVYDQEERLLLEWYSVLEKKYKLRDLISGEIPKI